MKNRLPWFPLEVEYWHNTLRGLHPTVKGVLLDFACWAWAHGEPAATLPDDLEELARLAGLSEAEWTTYGPRVLRCLRRDEARRRLVDPHVVALYERQMMKARKCQIAGQLGGMARVRGSRPTSTAELLAHPRLSGSLGIRQGDAQANGKPDVGANAQANAGQLLSECRPFVSPSSNVSDLEVSETKDARNTASERWSIASASASAPGGDSESALSLLALQNKYHERLKSRYDEWASENPDEAASLEAMQRQRLNLTHRQSTLRTGQILLAAVHDSFRENTGWPTCDEWVAQKLAGLPETTA
jgi:hypothetical protein